MQTGDGLGWLDKGACGSDKGSRSRIRGVGEGGVNGDRPSHRYNIPAMYRYLYHGPKRYTILTTAAAAGILV